ncbi:NAD(P)H-dependent oxidoreductase subunit E [Anaerosphaera multitolerans]|uniref:(2Fe-2S) ferredoxin domain-containing protein n=1 Tax=Anaerosphaera multitolerans TaxID=2487351 RepID=A0A437S5P0_9FIRM|nr:NAD(P)H-dependent oxidoreductase subunit E [Anaerosphaera multitolerans]RVU54330.1 (2Fe-2S) ferredoxin domain-containing protein [Anaerosphaera multitolerans]
MKVKICTGVRCTLMGADSIYDAVEYLKENVCGPDSNVCSAEDLEVELSTCLNYCKGEKSIAPVVVIDDEVIFKATAQEISEKLIDRLRI